MIGAIIPAAGYGKIGELPKVLADLDGKPVIVRVVESVVASGASKTIVVVVNLETGGDLVKRVLLDAGYQQVQFAVQPWRLGAADAVSRALPLLEAKNLLHALVVFGDMPFWSPATLQTLVTAQLHAQPSVSMLAIPYRAADPLAGLLKRYGLILRNARGQICGTEEASPHLAEGMTVNASLYVFNLEWLQRALPSVRPAFNCDGHEAEFHLPKLLGYAAEREGLVQEIRFSGDTFEAVGINTVEQLEYARAVYTSRLATACRS